MKNVRPSAAAGTAGYDLLLAISFFIERLGLNALFFIRGFPIRENPCDPWT